MMYSPNTWPNFNASVVTQNVCPGGSIYFRIVATTASGTCELSANPKDHYASEWG